MPDLRTEFMFSINKYIVTKIDKFDAEQTEYVRKFIRHMRFCEAYNGKKKLALTDQRHYNYYRVSSGEGLVFDGSNYNDDRAHLSSAGRLSFEKKEYLADIRKKYPHVYEDVIKG